MTSEEDTETIVLSDDEVREKAIAAFRDRDGQRVRGQATARKAYRNALSEAISEVFGLEPDLPEEIEAGKFINLYGLSLGLSPESKLFTHLECGKCGAAHGVQLQSLADVGKVYSAPTYVERQCKGKAKDFETDLLLILSDIRDSLCRSSDPIV